MIVFFIILSIIAFIILAIISLTIRIEILELKIDNLNKTKRKQFKSIVKFYIFKKIRVLKIIIDKQNIKDFNKNIVTKISKNIEKETFKEVLLPKNILKSRKGTKEHFKKLKIKIEKFILNLKVGTEDVLITTAIVPIISTVIAIFISRNSKKLKYKNIYYKILPIYGDKNLYSINFECIISAKLVHIIYIIYMLKKGKKVSDKFDGASNRKFNANCNV